LSIGFDRRDGSVQATQAWPDEQPSDVSGLVEPVDAGARRGWRSSYLRVVLLADLTGLLAASMVAWLLRFGGSNAQLQHGGFQLGYLPLALALVPIWMLALATNRGYEGRFLASGSEEYQRVFGASVRLVAVVALLAYSLKLELARGFIALVLPLGCLMLLVSRRVCKVFLQAQRARGRAMDRVLVVGDRAGLVDLVAQLRRDRYAGMDVVGACLPAGRDSEIGDVLGVPVVGTVGDVEGVATLLNVDAVAVTASPGVTSAALRRLSWGLEGTGIDLLVAPALTDVAGPRISMRPVAGLPLIHVEEPELTGLRYAAKSLMDRSLSVGALLLLAPLMLVVALAVRVTSSGPVCFRQQRVGKRGKVFTILKFRTMYSDAEERKADLAHLNECDGAMFKIRNDPRVTPVGRVLRKWSIDELPQLLNVVRGDMSLVGPRPPLPSEVAQYESDVHRRLLVKPGITGLWQISGRSDLSWEETVRQDLFYVENWSFAMDLSILIGTLRAVVKGAGAY
jgi:exopolysaccharide biosynthesis polyprenyl glycosylphosphotransferase